MKYLLDTNIVSYIIKADANARRHLFALPVHEVAISVVTQAELYFGVAKRGHPPGLSARVEALLKCTAVLPWTTEIASHYGQLRADLERAGRSLAPLDMMIAAHAAQVGATLVTRDQAFQQIPGLKIERWT
jgi:tRNA(fMet)-specific endonuclease VapC